MQQQIDLTTLPRTSPFGTTAACADGNHEGLHEFKRSKAPWTDEQTEDLCATCGQPYGNQDRQRTHLPWMYPLVCHGSVSGPPGSRCQCLCHPFNRTHGHWHIVNPGGGRKTICLGRDALRTELQQIKKMPPKAYLKRMESDSDDACWERDHRRI